MILGLQWRLYAVQNEIIVSDDTAFTILFNAAHYTNTTQPIKDLFKLYIKR